MSLLCNLQGTYYINTLSVGVYGLWGQGRSRVDGKKGRKERGKVRQEEKKRGKEEKYLVV